VHLSDENETELVTYYRTFKTLQDGAEMQGNCKKADPKRSCAYPCFFEETTYGVAIKGFQAAPADGFLRAQVQIDIDRSEEPDPRDSQKPVPLRAVVTARGVTPGRVYRLYRYEGLNSFPVSGTAGYASVRVFTPTADVWRFKDPQAFLSDGAVYYVAERAGYT